MAVTNSGNPVTIKDLEDLDEHITAVVRKTHQELLTELQTTQLEVEKLRTEVNDLKQQVPPKMKTL
jgi:uncharacterized protein YlxW (UPF0749 family)